MLITEEEMHRRLSSSKNLANKIASGSVVSPTVAQKGSISFPTDSTATLPKPPTAQKTFPAKEIMATVAASLVKQGCNPKDAVKELGLTFKDIRSPNEQAVANSMEKIRELALNKLMFTLGCMTPDMLEGASLKELSNVTGNLARVLDKTAPAEINDNRVQFIVMQPAVRPMNDYQVIDV